LKGLPVSDVSLQLVREYFELNFFYILPHWGIVAGQTKELETGSSLLFVEQQGKPNRAEPEFLLRSGDIAALHRAAVEVRAWHGGKLYSSAIGATSLFSRVASRQTHDLATALFKSDNYKIVLVVSELPISEPAKKAALEKLHARGIHHVIEFRTILGDLLRQISAQGNYGPSKTLQTLKLLKRYGFIHPEELRHLNLPLDS